MFVEEDDDCAMQWLSTFLGIRTPLQICIISWTPKNFFNELANPKFIFCCHRTIDFLLYSFDLLTSDEG